MKKFAVLLLAGLVAGCVINFQSEKQAKGIIHVDVHYVYPGKCELNTFDGFYKKETDVGRYAQTKIALDPGQQLLCLNRAFVYHFFQMPDSFYHKEGTGGELQSLRIKADSLDRTIYWRGSTDSLLPAKFRPKQLIEYIDSIVQSTDEYQALPKSKLTGY